MGTQAVEGTTMCYTSSSPRVSASDITGKTGERPARFRHCDEGLLLHDHSARHGSGKVKSALTRAPLSQETYPGA